MKGKEGLFVLEQIPHLHYVLIGLLILGLVGYIAHQYRSKHREKADPDGDRQPTTEPLESIQQVAVGEIEPIQQEAAGIESNVLPDVREDKYRRIPLSNEIVEHYQGFLRTSPTSILEDQGDIPIVVFPPKGKRGWWTYATAGLSKVTRYSVTADGIVDRSSTKPLGVELTLCSYNEAEEIINHFVKTVSQIMNDYRSQPTSVSPGAVFALQKPIVPHSSLSHLLVIPPYFEEDGFEYYLDREALIHVLSLVPVSEQECEFCREYGLDALESKFEEKECNTLDFFRESTV